MKNQQNAAKQAVQAEPCLNDVSTITTLIPLQAHKAEWELVNDALPTGTLNELIDDLVRQVETPNGAPLCIFMPLVNAVLAKRNRLNGGAA